MSTLKKIAILLDGSRGWDAGILKGFAQYTNLHHCWEILRPASTYYQRFAGLSEVTLEALLKLQPDGILMHESELTSKLTQKGIPVVVIPVGARVPDGHYIESDNQQSGLIAADYLKSLGLREFAFVGFAESLWSQERHRAFAEGLALADKNYHDYTVPLSPADFDQPRLSQDLFDWLIDLPKPIGIFAANDDLARPIAEICKRNHINIPDDIVLLGCDNDELICELSSPPISSIPFATEKSGYETAESLDQLLMGHDMGPIDIHCPALPLVVRKSSDRLAIEDQEVVKAVRFIRDNSRNALRANDVVDATALSHRTLHNRFKDALGHSIIKEINRQRAMHIATLLTETTMSIGRISWQLGFNDPSHMVRFFRREMGESPGAYRSRMSAVSKY